MGPFCCFPLIVLLAEQKDQIHFLTSFAKLKSISKFALLHMVLEMGFTRVYLLFLLKKKYQLESFYLEFHRFYAHKGLLTIFNPS